MPADVFRLAIGLDQGIEVVRGCHIGRARLVELAALLA
jgi:hypothetical protein